MATSVLTEPQLRSEVAEILGLTPEPLAIGLRTVARWAGPEVVEYSGRRHKVVAAASVLDRLGVTRDKVRQASARLFENVAKLEQRLARQTTPVSAAPKPA